LRWIQREPELTDIEVTAGVGKRLLEFMELVLLLCVGGLVIASNDGEGGTTGYDTFGGGIYYSPESIPATISVAYDTKDNDSGNDESDLFVGIDYEVGPGTLSAAYNSRDVDGGSAADSTGFEVSYTYAVNDSMTITPGFFTVEDTGAGDDDSGVVVETVFSF